MKVITIKDIAKLAGVSVTTVSRVLNRRPDVNPVTREKVERIIEENSFVGNKNARGLKQISEVSANRKNRTAVKSAANRFSIFSISLVL